jgi:hypothetical protein
MIMYEVKKEIKRKRMENKIKKGKWQREGKRKTEPPEK